MSVEIEARETDRAPGSHRSSHDRLRSYLVGLALAMVLTAASFAALSSNLVWSPSIPVLLAVLGLAVHSLHKVPF